MSKKLTKQTQVDKLADERESEIMAQIGTDPIINASGVVKSYSSGFGELKLVELSKTLQNKANDITQRNNLASCEEMLIGQAHALQSIFTTLSKSALNQTHVKNFESSLRFALKAQSQCRSTIETLANIKNPPVVYAKQANISQGHQQVNNTMPREEKNKTDQNELLEEQEVKSPSNFSTKRPLTV